MTRTKIVLRRMAVTMTLTAAALAAHAGGGEALDIELPSMRTPVATQLPDALAPAGTSTMDMPQAEAGGPLTRAEVRESLRTARAAGIVTPGGELGDTEEVLARREQFYAMQTEVRQAEYAAAAEREAQRLADLQAAAQAEQTAALASGEVVSPDMTVAELFARFEGADEVLLVIEEEEEADPSTAETPVGADAAGAVPTQ